MTEPTIKQHLPIGEGPDKGLRAAILIFARLDSRRLPGKVLADLGGVPLLCRLTNRLRRSQSGLPLIIATSDRAVDDPIAEFAASQGLATFRGDCTDVAGRALACLTANDLDWFVRISGDSPFLDPAVVDQVVEAFLQECPDIATNVFPRTYPRGSSVEVITGAAMAQICESTSDPDLREHVTAYAYRCPANFSIVNVVAGHNRWLDRSIAVDEPQDLAIARRIVASLAAPDDADLDTIVAAWSDSRNS